MLSLKIPNFRCDRVVPKLPELTGETMTTIDKTEKEKSR